MRQFYLSNLLAFVAFFHAFPTALQAQRSDDRSADAIATELANKITKVWRSGFESNLDQVATVETSPTISAGLIPLEQIRVRFNDQFEWTLARDVVKKRLLERFTFEELQTIATFYQSSAGQKMLAQTPALEQTLSQLVQHGMLRAKLSKVAEGQLREKLSSMEPADQKFVIDAMKENSVDTKNLLGRWHADDRDETGEGYVGWNERQRSGKWTTVARSVDHQAKEYWTFDDEGIWFSKGRLIVEISSQPGSLALFTIVEEATPTVLKSRTVDETIGHSEWPLNEDDRIPIKIPEMPLGYRDPLVRAN
ncbi:DUF2059 domain-containing protein [Rhodopirellula sp. MGV]|uniref:DUF2059 domain-containing protein n=1 Tax=Rhodopirellula sp. MGV TaxID=2023130 RepID=UPI001179A698|nr:DUF2059 domain-containing protein [Rhodopirellula sp. MGV]